MENGDKSSSEIHAARNSHRPVNFYVDAARAKSVEITGDFSHWAPVPMQHRIDGWWFIQISLTHGHHRYRFLVDGRPMLDPLATGIGRDDRDAPASLVAVS